MSRRTRKKSRSQPAEQGSSWNWINAWTLGGAALVLVGALGFLIAATRPSSPATSQPSAAGQADIPYPEVPRTPLEEVKAKFDAGEGVIVDTRSATEYAQGHIPNAVSLPLSELSTQNPDLSRDAEIITYCT